MASPELRLRVPSPELLALPWRQPLAEWDVTQVDLRDIPVGPSRHLVRFVHADDRLWALKALPHRIAEREYRMLRALEDRALAAVRPAGIVMQDADAAILVTAYLERSWQYRRLLMRIPSTRHAHRGRLFEAMATLLVDLHRNGVYWGDCSLANTLFMRDGQTIEAWLVDAETAELQPSLSRGQRDHDLEIMIENVTGGLLDVAARREEPPDLYPQIFAEAQGVADRYERLWNLLHAEPVVGLDERDRIGDRVRGLEDAGFAVDEVRLEPVGTPDRDDAVRLTVAVAGRRYHADRLRALTGIVAGEGQARILLDDLHGHHERLRRVLGDDVTEQVSARHWLLESFEPRSTLAHEALHGRGDPVQAYCDLLEVRWLLSEEAGHDVGDEPALAALADRVTPSDSAAHLSFVDLPTTELPAIGTEAPPTAAPEVIDLDHPPPYPGWTRDS